MNDNWSKTVHVIRNERESINTQAWELVQAKLEARRFRNMIFLLFITIVAILLLFLFVIVKP